MSEMLFTARMKVTDRHSGFRCFFQKDTRFHHQTHISTGFLASELPLKEFSPCCPFVNLFQKMCLKLPLKTRQAVAIKLLFDGRVIAITRGSGVFRTNECSDEFVSDLIASHSRIGVGGQLKSNWECGQDS